MAGAAIAGGVISIAGQQQAARAQRQAAEYNARVGELNAGLSIKQAAEDERQQRAIATQVIGQGRASYGASGVSSTQGSALDVLQASARNAELDALNIRHRGQLKAWAAQTGARLDTMEADSATRAGLYGGVATALNAGTRYYSLSNIGGD